MSADDRDALQPHAVRKVALSTKRVFWVTCIALSAGVGIVWLCVPGAHDQLLEENQFVENLTAAVFAVAAVTGFLALCRVPRGASLWQHSLIPLLALLAFLDEVSYGLNLFWPEHEVPTLWGYPFDGVHDLPVTFFKLVRDSGNAVLQVGCGVGLGVGAGVAYLYRRAYMPWLMHRIRIFPAFDYIRFAFIFILAAQVLDLDVLMHPLSYVCEELLEACGGVALLFGGITLFLTQGAPCADIPDETPGHTDDGG